MAGRDHCAACSLTTRTPGEDHVGDEQRPKLGADDEDAVELRLFELARDHALGCDEARRSGRDLGRRADPHEAMRTRREEGALLMERTPVHRVAGKNVLRDGAVKEALGRADRDPSRGDEAALPFREIAFVRRGQRGASLAWWTSVTLKADFASELWRRRLRNPARSRFSARARAVNSSRPG